MPAAALPTGSITRALDFITSSLRMRHQPKTLRRAFLDQLPAAHENEGYTNPGKVTVGGFQLLKHPT